MEKLVTTQINRLRNMPWPRNWVLKLLSLSFAIFLWFFVVGEDKVDMTVNIPVEIVNMPEALIISNQFKKNLEVTVNGPRSLIRRISSQHISRTIDLSGAKSGTIIIKNTLDTISLPRGVRLLRIKPTDIILRLDQLIQKNIPIIANTTGKPATGYEVNQININPTFIPITGPQTILDNNEEFYTKPIDISNLATTAQVNTSLDLSPESINLVGEPIVNVNIIIRPEQESP